MANWKTQSRRTIFNVLAYSDANMVSPVRLVELLANANPFPSDRLGAVATYRHEVKAQLEKRKARAMT
jgi:hypothetical protein